MLDIGRPKKGDEYELEAAQKRAFELWSEAACLANDFRPLTERAVCEKLMIEGIRVSPSAINRWKKKLRWSERLKTIIDAALAGDKNIKKVVAKSSANKVIESAEVDIKLNGRLLSLSYATIIEEATRIRDKQIRGSELTLADKKIILEFAKFAGEREDKMLDRLAGTNNQQISGAEILNKLIDINSEINIDSEVIIDV